MKRNYFNLICSLIFVFGIFSCSNLFDASVKSSGNNFSGKYCICGTIDMDGAVPQQIKSAAQSQNTTGGRAAYPDRIEGDDFDDSNPSYYYYKVWTTVNGEKKDATVTGNTYSLDVTNDGSYTIEGGLFYKQEDIDDDIQVMFFTSENPVVINESNKVIDCKVELKARQTTTGKGRIFLGIGYDSEDFNENEIYFSYYEESLGPENESNKVDVQSDDFYFTGSGDSNFYSPYQDKTNSDFLPNWTEYTSGAHKFVFNFYDGNSADANLIYQVRETVNVFDNMITDCWVPVGKPEYLKDGGFVITKECLNSFELKNIYVDSTVSVSGSNDSEKIINDKKHSGSLMDPFHYLDNAIDKVNSLNSDGPFTIHIASGTYVTTKTINVKKSFTLEGEGRDKTVIEDKGESTFIIFYNADSNISISVKNLNYTINKDIEGSAFINVDSSPSETRKINIDNVIVTSNNNELNIYNVIKVEKEQLCIKNSIFKNVIISFDDEDNGEIMGSLIKIDGQTSISTIENTDFISCDISNKGEINGGLIRNAGTLYLKNVNFYGNKITTTGSSNTITGGLIYNCFACDFNNVQFGKSDQDKNIITSCGGISGGLLYNINDVLCKNCNFTNTQMKVTADTIISGAIYNINTPGSNHCILEDCKIFDIDAEGSTEVKGVGAYVIAGRIITLKGTTWFDEDSDIYLDFTAGSPAASGQIEIATNLYPVDNRNTLTDYAAKINGRVESGAYMAYTNSKPIMNGSAVETEYFKFAVKQNPKTSNIYWRVNKSGFLDTKIGTKAPGEYAVGDIVFNDGSATPYSVIESTGLTEAEKNAAIAVIFRVGDGFDGNKTLGVGIKHETTACFASSSKGCSINFTNTVCVPDSGTNHGSFTFINSENTDGSLNLKKMIEKNANDTGIIFNEDGTVNFESSNQTTLATNYPAFEFAYYYGKNGHNIISESEYETGWYLPSVSELNDIYLENKSTNIIQEALIAAGGIDFNNKNYLTSTQECDSGYTNCVTGFYIDEGRKNYIGKNTNDNQRYACAVRAFN